MSENDYIYRPGAEGAIVEGMSFSDYVSLYDHPDKYALDEYHENVCGIDGIRLRYSDLRTKLFSGRYGYWRTVPNTTGTFGTRVSILLEDLGIHKRYCIEDPDSPAGGAWHDAPVFHNLVLVRQRRLVSPMPGYATHADWFSPYINWENCVKGI